MLWLAVFVAALVVVPNSLGAPHIGFGRRLDDFVINRVFFEGLWGTNYSYIDLGGNHALHHSNTMLFHNKNWRGVVVEPSPVFSWTHRVARSHLTTVVLQAAATAESAGFVSLSGDGEKISVAASNESRGTPCVSMPAVCGLLDNVVTFASIDVEGHELPVLTGNNWSVCRPSVVYIEDVHEARRFQLRDVLLAEGYLDVGMYHGNRILVDGAVAPDGQLPVPLPASAAAFQGHARDRSREVLRSFFSTAPKNFNDRGGWDEKTWPFAPATKNFVDAKLDAWVAAGEVAHVSDVVTNAAAQGLVSEVSRETGLWTPLADCLFKKESYGKVVDVRGRRGIKRKRIRVPVQTYENHLVPTCYHSQLGSHFLPAGRGSTTLTHPWVGGSEGTLIFGFCRAAGACVVTLDGCVEAQLARVRLETRRVAGVASSTLTLADGGRLTFFDFAAGPGEDSEERCVIALVTPSSTRHVRCSAFARANEVDQPHVLDVSSSDTPPATECGQFTSGNSNIVTIRGMQAISTLLFFLAGKYFHTHPIPALLVVLAVTAVSGIQL